MEECIHFGNLCNELHCICTCECNDCEFERMHVQWAGEEEWRFIDIILVDTADIVGQTIAAAEVGSLQVKCGVCGREYDVVLTPTWFVHQGRVPDVWICSEHRGSFVWSIAYTKVAICKCMVSRWCVLVMGLGIEDTCGIHERNLLVLDKSFLCTVRRSDVQKTRKGSCLRMINRLRPIFFIWVKKMHNHRQCL